MSHLHFGWAETSQLRSATQKTARPSARKGCAPWIFDERIWPPESCWPSTRVDFYLSITDQRCDRWVTVGHILLSVFFRQRSFAVMLFPAMKAASDPATSGDLGCHKFNAMGPRRPQKQVKQIHTSGEIATEKWAPKSGVSIPIAKKDAIPTWEDSMAGRQLDQLPTSIVGGWFASAFHPQQIHIVPTIVCIYICTYTLHTLIYSYTWICNCSCTIHMYIYIYPLFS